MWPNRMNGIVRHLKDQHPNSEEPPKFNYTLLKRHKTCLERQVFETINCHNIMNGKGECGRNLTLRLQILPEEEFRNTQHTSQDSQGTQILTKSTTKRTALGFTKIPSEDPQQVLKAFPQSNIQPDSFEGQYRQRKRLRIATQRDMNKTGKV